MRVLARRESWVTAVFVMGSMAACGSAASRPAEDGSSAATAQPASAARSTAPDLSSEQAFTSWTAQRLNAISPQHPVKVAGPLALAGGQNDALEIYLDRAWNYCKSGAADCTAMVDDFLNRARDALAASGKPRSPPRAEQLRPALRTEDTVQGYSRVAELVAEPFAGDLWILYMVDTPDAASPLSVADLVTLDMTREQVRVRALANLREEMGALAPRINVVAKDALGFVDPPHYYNSSLLLLASEWPAVAARFGKLLVSVPSVDVLLYVDAAEPMAAAALAAISVDTLRKAEVPLSPTILIWTDKGFQPYSGAP